MPLVSMRQVLDAAADGGYGVGAFNVNNMEQIQGIMEATRETASPVIVQASRGARAYAGDRFLLHLMQDAAVAIGTSHGAYKFSRVPDGDILAMHLIEEVHRRLPATHLVMHGSSSVPADLVERINGAGGRLAPAFGVPVEQIQQGIRHGVRKVNVDTDGRLAITAAVREALSAAPEEFDPRHFTKAGRAGMREVVAERMREFGQAGHAGDYVPLTLAHMRERYAAASAAV
jgi:fructose-bisphosphate aldolase class II